MGKAGGHKKKTTDRPRRVSWLGALLLLVTGIVPLGLVGTFLCGYIPPGRFGITSLLGLAFPWLVLASAALGIV